MSLLMSFFQLDNTKKIKRERFCTNCNSNQTYINKRTGSPQWRKGLCQRCYDRLIHNPRWNPIINKMKIRFKNKFYYLGFNPRKGICKLCGMKNGDKFVNRMGKETVCKTEIHHHKYHPEDILRDSIELCNRCHGKITGGMRWNKF